MGTGTGWNTQARSMGSPEYSMAMAEYPEVGLDLICKHVQYR